MKGIAFDSWRSVGLAAQAVRIHSARGVDELALLDITATAEGRNPDIELVKELSEVCFMPLAVGGGVRSLEDIDSLLRAGADKVIINTAAWEVDGFIDRAVDRFGRQAIVVSVDVGKNGEVRTRSGKQTLTIDAIRWANIVGQSAGEILLNSVELDGKMDGYDLPLIAAVSGAVSVPVIAAGGCGTYDHMRQAIEHGADAVAAGAMFIFTDATPQGAAQYLAKSGIEARVA